MTANDQGAGGASATRAASRAQIAAENWRLLEYFNYFRLTVAVLAGVVALSVGTLPPFGEARPGLFLSTSVTYAVLAMLAVVTIRMRLPDFDTHATLLSFADVALLTLLMRASGGIGSGVGLLLLVAVAGASLMLGRRLTVFYASIAAIAALLEQGWDLFRELASGGGLDAGGLEGFPQAGVFGIGLYATAFIGHYLSGRLRATEALAEKRGVDVANLAELNALVIQRMQSGLLVCDAAGQVRQMNDAAEKYLGVKRPDGPARLTLSDAAPDLGIQLVQWLGQSPEQRTRHMFRSRSGYTLLPRFVTLGAGGEETPKGPGGAAPGAVLVFLDDMAILKKQAQELKMSALARLTASIAHEIRNPLGALSNAAQLLSESEAGNDEDKRLLKIIDEQTRRMNVIVQNVTQLSRRDQIHPVRHGLDPWIGDFLRQYCETAAVSREALARTGDGGLSVCVDPDQLYQVVSNLCQNALRASPPFSGTPLVKLQTGTDTEGRPFLDVIDWGSGVAPEITDNIFDPFFTTTPKGTGLGLYIAREFCEGNGGALDYFPGDGGVGSRFRVTFARAEECADSVAL